MKRIVLFAIILSFLLQIVFVGHAIGVPAVESDIKISYSHNPDDDFVPGEVLVSIKKEYSSLDKEWSIDDFSGIAISSITDLMYIDNEESINWVNSGEFRQILRLELYENSKEAVLNAIEELDKLEFVRTAAPNQSYEIEFPQEEVVSVATKSNLAQSGDGSVIETKKL